MTELLGNAAGSPSSFAVPHPAAEGTGGDDRVVASDLGGAVGHLDIGVEASARNVLPISSNTPSASWAPHTPQTSPLIEPFLHH
ncbi:hypothetical protein ACFW9D_27960 [Streptomyces sp. NPDC059524]|uniref:hypothetical protein n=1 Tax=Streptomyces sp. NPDC059524 TaxID=3346856 RepID=UPI0036A854A6